MLENKFEGMIKSLVTRGILTVGAIIFAIAAFLPTLADDAPSVTVANAVSGEESINTVGGNGGLFSSVQAGGVSGEIALTYDAVITDSDGVPVGTATFKT
ncbi:MAG: hypothetical protein IJU69_01430 [Bacteroidales bacterium]|nr:hypothetical protein [Bacteroidales bacterium]